VRITNQNNGRTAIVRINDRGPFIRGRVIDLSPAAARVLDLDGLAQVSLVVVQDKDDLSERGRSEVGAPLNIDRVDVDVSAADLKSEVSHKQAVE
jgi:rare lipoprotein A